MCPTESFTELDNSVKSRDNRPTVPKRQADPVERSNPDILTPLAYQRVKTRAPPSSVSKLSLPQGSSSANGVDLVLLVNTSELPCSTRPLEVQFRVPILSYPSSWKVSSSVVKTSSSEPQISGISPDLYQLQAFNGHLQQTKRLGEVQSSLLLI